MHGYIINGKRRHSAIFWLAVISVLVISALVRDGSGCPRGH